ncbi:VWA domain-containing protein [Photorhabdus asymbiotica]|uniref:VWA domain-containing protein n=1 Tax=Photorhabdus asymbiotica TaxID=291112 RepID=UPI003DA74A98
MQSVLVFPFALLFQLARDIAKRLRYCWQQSLFFTLSGKQCSLRVCQEILTVHSSAFNFLNLLNLFRGITSMGIYNSLPIVARALSSQLGVDVTVGGRTAFTYQDHDRFCINIPFYRNAEELSEILLGYLVHESAHVRFTDFKLFEKKLADKVQPGKYNRDVLHKLVNITEDLRIERAIGRRFPGTPAFLKALRTFLFDKDAEPSDHPSIVFVNTMLMCGFNRYHGLSIPTKQVREDFERLFGLKLFDQSMTILAEAVNADSISKCLDVSCRLYDLAVDAFNEQKQQQQQSDDSQDSQSSLSDFADDVKGDDSSSTSGSTSVDKSFSDPFSDTTEKDLSEVMKDASEKLNEALEDKVPSSKRVPAPAPYSVAPAKRNRTTDTSVNRGIQFASGLRQSMHGLLQGMQQVRRTHKDTGRKLDTRLLTSALLGNTKLFKHKSKIIEFNCAFTVLLDTSGSLKCDVVEAEAAVVSMLYALEGIKGVSTSAYYFPHATKNNVGLMKGREQTFRAAINAHQFGLVASGSTPLSESLWPAFSDLLSAKADRHVMIVVTDGDPDDTLTAEQMIKDAKQDGLLVIGIGFGSANQTLMTTLFGDTGIAVGSVSSLRGQLLKVTRRALSR